MARPAFLFDNRLSDAVPIASTTEPVGDFNVLNLRDWAAFTFWKPTALPATVTVDSGAAKAADYGLIWGHDLFSKGTVVEFRGSDDNFVASNDLLARVTPANDKPFAVYFPKATHRYWRVLLGRVNLLSWSEALDNAAWVKIGAPTVNADAHVAPDGSVTAEEIVNDGVDPAAGVKQTLALSPSQAHGLSCHLKRIDTLSSRFGLWDETAGVWVGWLDIGWTGSVPSTLTSSGISGIAYTDLGTGWWRVSFDITTSVNTSFSVRLQPDRNALGSALYAWGVQLESSAGVSAYSKTEGAAPQPTLAIAAIGDLLEVPAGLVQGFDPTRRTPRGPFSRSVEGHPLGKTLFFEHWEANLRFRWVSWDWVRSTFIPAWKAHLRGTPFVFAWDRGNYPAEIFLVNNTRGFTSPHRTGPAVELGMRVQGLALE